MMAILVLGSIASLIIGFVVFMAGAMSDAPAEGSRAAGTGIILFFAGFFTLVTLSLNYFFHFLPFQ